MRYRLRTLLIVVAVICVWLALRLNAVRRQQAAVAAIQRLGGTVYYAHQITEDRLGRLVAEPDKPPPFPTWLRPMAEPLFPPAVASVSLRDTPTTNRDLEILRFLPHVQRLDLANTAVTDDGLAIVGRLRELESLSVRGPAISDRGVEHLKNLRLTHLSLWKTSVTDVGVRHLRRMTTLRWLLLDETQITDAALEDVGELTNLDDWLGLTDNQLTDAGLPHLRKLTKLRSLNLLRTKASPEGLRQLRVALPATDISPQPWEMKSPQQPEPP
jgi:Leucine-rich repeat (LRR) protein